MNKKNFEEEVVILIPSQNELSEAEKNVAPPLEQLDPPAGPGTSTVWLKIIELDRR